ncbi:hypothetical protein [Viridibacillus arvi]
MGYKINLSDEDVKKIAKGCIQQSEKYGIPRKKKKQKAIKK